MSDDFYTKNPVTIEAKRYTQPSDELDLSIWSDGKVYARKGNPGLFIDTLDGTAHASLGDWIIRGVKGEYYPCKPEIFAQTYDKAESHYEKQRRLADACVAQTAEPHDTCLDHREYVLSVLRAAGVL